jgi:hypothetical protein
MLRHVWQISVAFLRHSRRFSDRSLVLFNTAGQTHRPERLLCPCGQSANPLTGLCWTFFRWSASHYKYLKIRFTLCNTTHCIMLTQSALCYGIAGHVHYVTNHCQLQIRYKVVRWVTGSLRWFGRTRSEELNWLIRWEKQIKFPQFL